MTAPHTRPPTLSIGVAARELNVSVDTLRRWEAEGKIQSTRTLGGQRRYSPDEISRVRGLMAGPEKASA